MTDSELKTARRIVTNLDSIVDGPTTEILIAAAIISAIEQAEVPWSDHLQKGWPEIYSQVMVMEP